MGEVTIRNLESLIEQYTGPGKKLVESQVIKHTAPGDNYLGLVLKVTGTLRNEDGKEEKFSAIAKCLNFNLPEFMKKMIPPQYNKERAFYADIVPVLQSFQDEKGLEGPSIKDVFPILLTCRKNLNDSSEEADGDAVLLFENLNEQGFANADRTIGFDLDGAELILKDLAFFHAITIAFKLQKPEEFETKIKIHLKNLFDFDHDDPPPRLPKENVWVQIFRDYEEIKPYLATLEEKFKVDFKDWKERMRKIPKEPFASISHNDLWTNNTMQVFNGEKAIKNKLIDFQVYIYDSIAKDLLFFICSSVILPVIQEHFDDLIKFYHKHFVNILDKLGCDTAPFSYANFLEVLNEEAGNEIQHIIFMLTPIYGKKGEAAFDINDKEGGPMNLKKENVSETAKSRAVHIVRLFGDKGWI